MKRRRYRQRWWRVLFLFLLISVLVVTAFQWDRWFIRQIEVSGNHVIPDEEIEASVLTVLSGYHWRVFPRRHLLLYPRRELEDELFEKFPRIENVFVEGDTSGTLLIQITERRGEIIWCLPTFSEDQTCYFTDLSGFLFSVAPKFSAPVYFEIHGPVAGEPIGVQAIEPEKARTLDALRSALNRVLAQSSWSDYQINRADYLDDWEFKFHATSKTGKSFSILVALDREVDSVPANLETILKSADLQEQIGPAGNLEYLDLRFPPKVFYK